MVARTRTRRARARASTVTSTDTDTDTGADTNTGTNTNTSTITNTEYLTLMQGGRQEEGQYVCWCVEKCVCVVRINYQRFYHKHTNGCKDDKKKGKGRDRSRSRSGSRRGRQSPQQSERDKRVSTHGVTAKLVFFDRGAFRVPPLTYFHIPQSARAYLFPQSDKINYFCSGAISVDPICPPPTLVQSTSEREHDPDRLQSRGPTPPIGLSKTNIT